MVEPSLGRNTLIYNDRPFLNAFLGSLRSKHLTKLLHQRHAVLCLISNPPSWKGSSTLRSDGGIGCNALRPGISRLCLSRQFSTRKSQRFGETRRSAARARPLPASDGQKLFDRTTPGKMNGVAPGLGKDRRKRLR